MFVADGECWVKVAWKKIQSTKYWKTVQFYAKYWYLKGIRYGFYYGLKLNFQRWVERSECNNAGMSPNVWVLHFDRNKILADDMSSLHSTKVLWKSRVELDAELSRFPCQNT